MEKVLAWIELELSHIALDVTCVHVFPHVLGRGAHSIRLCQFQGRNVAGKVIDVACMSSPTDAQLDQLRREVAMMQTLESEYTMPLLGIVVDSAKSRLILLMEIADLKSLRNYSSSLAAYPSVRTSVRLLRDACLGLRALHRVHLLHLNVKPDNLLVVRDPATAAHTDTCCVKVSDFGVSRTLSAISVPAGVQVGQGGTYAYMAPEQMIGGGECDITAACDVYSFGVTALELLTDVNPLLALSTVDVVRFHLAKRTLIAPRCSAGLPAH